MNVLDALKGAIGLHVMVTVASTRGSTPRKAGMDARWGDGPQGTIGGGTELRAIEWRGGCCQVTNKCPGSGPSADVGRQARSIQGGEATLLFERVRLKHLGAPCWKHLIWFR